MNKQELGQLFYLEKEIKFLEEQMRECNEKSEKEQSDSISAKINEYQNLICNQIHKLYNQKIDIEIYIQTIGDSQLRSVMRMRYIEFYSWIKIAYKIGAKTEATPRMMIDRFFEEK